MKEYAATLAMILLMIVSILSALGSRIDSTLKTITCTTTDQVIREITNDDNTRKNASDAGRGCSARLDVR
jgi:hypothetical protein